MTILVKAKLVNLTSFKVYNGQEDKINRHYKEPHHK
jgi:hypothetical protein